MKNRVVIVTLLATVLAGCAQPENRQQEIYTELKNGSGSIGVFNNDFYSFTFTEDSNAYLCIRDLRDSGGEDGGINWEMTCSSGDSDLTGKVLSMKTKVLFDFNKSSLKATEESRRTLNSLVQAIEYFDQVSEIRIEGHADRVGGDEVNYNLSVERGYTLAAYLESNGVDRALIEVIGQGETMPVKECIQTEKAVTQELIDCLEPNRRVDVIIKGVSSGK